MPNDSAARAHATSENVHPVPPTPHMYGFGMLWRPPGILRAEWTDASTMLTPDGARHSSDETAHARVNTFAEMLQASAGTSSARRIASRQFLREVRNIASRETSG